MGEETRMLYKGWEITPVEVSREWNPGSWRCRISGPGIATDGTRIYKLRGSAIRAARRKVRRFLRR